MLAPAKQLFDSSEFTPLWNNGSWPPGLGWLHISSDLVIWAAYLLIPCLICYYTIRRKDIPYLRTLLLCIAFLVLSGLTHMLEAIMFWWPAYRLSGLLKLLTAVVSLVTIFVLFRMTPQLITLPSPIAFEKQNAERIRAEEALADQVKLTEGILDSIQAHVAVIDSHGVIRAVNSSWRRFAIENAGDPTDSVTNFHIGNNYLEVCRKCDAKTCEDAQNAAQGIESVLRGETLSFNMVYPCHSASANQWFSLNVTPLKMLGGAVISHTDITQQKLAEISAGINVRAAVGVCMAEGGSLKQILSVCCEAILEGLGTSFVRAWTLDPTGSTLEMQCSVGLYTHIDGPHGRVPVGQFKIGKIAQTCQPLMTNSIIGDVNIPEQEWAIREKITAFAGYPLLVDGRAVGVLATFSQRAFNSVEFECLGAIADFIAEVISRKRAETSILESEARYRAAIESSPDGYWMVDDKGRLLDVNDIYAKRSGYDKQELLGMPLTELEVKESQEEMAEHIAKIRRQGNGRFETIHRAKDGTTWPVEVSVAYCSLSGGRFFAFLRDISERVRAEEALRESERRFQVLTTISPVGVFRTDESGNCVYVNERWCQISGISNDDALGTKWGQAIHPDDRELVFSTWTKAVSKRQKFRLEYRFCDPLGAITWVLGLAVPEQSERGEIGGYVGTITDITELKRAESQLRTSEERFRTTFEQAAVGIAHVDLEGGFIWVNERFASITGRTREELLAGGFQAITHPDDLELDLRQISLLLSGEVPHYSLEKRYLKKGGGIVWVNLTVSLRRNAEGVPVHFISVIEDIDNRKMAEEEIQRLQNDLERQVQERTAELLEAQRLARVGSWVWHLDEDRLTWTAEMYRIFGLDSTLPAPKFADRAKFYSPESWVRLQSALRACMENGTPFAFELEIHRLDGTIGTITSQGEAERDDTGRVIRLRGTKQDISELRETEAELRRVSERLQLATEAGNVGIWDWDISNNVLTWDQAMYSLYGISRDQFSGAYEAWQAGVHPEDRVRGDQEIQLALRDEKSFDTEFRVIWPDQSVHFIRAHAVVQRSLSGEPMRMVGTNWDITETKQAEESIRTLNDSLLKRTAQVEAANKELEAFSYSVSHDLRAPLRAISGFSQILMEDHNKNLPEDAQDSLREVCENARRMGRLIDDLLCFSRLGRQELKKSVTSMDTMVRQSVSILSLDQPVEFRIAILSTAYVDPVLIKQVWQNLIENALKYSGTRTPPVIEIGTIDGNREKIYFVKDNGVGFDMQYVHKLFKVFSRLHHQHEFEGTGVGLAIVQRLIHRHGGRVWAEAQPGLGATFYFSLPHKGIEQHERSC